MSERAAPSVMDGLAQRPASGTVIGAGARHWRRPQGLHADEAPVRGQTADRRILEPACGDAIPAATGNGQEDVALRRPMTREEKQAQIEKAQREGVNVSDLMAEYPRTRAKA